MKLIPLNPVSPASVLLFSLLNTHQFIVFPVHHSLKENDKSSLKHGFSTHLSKLDHLHTAL